MDSLASGIRELDHLLCRLNTYLNYRTRDFLTDRGVSLARFWVLRSLFHQQSLNMGELQKKLRLASATITGLVDGLVESKLVKRWRDENDRRLVYLALTEEGVELMESVIRLRVSILRQALSGQTIDLEKLNTALGMLLDRLTADEAPDCTAN